MERPGTNTHAYVSDQAHLSAWKIAMETRSADISSALTTPVTDLCDSVHDIISEPSIPVDFKQKMVTAWKQTKNEILGTVNASHSQIAAVINRVYLKTTTEEGIGCMIVNTNSEAYKLPASQAGGRNACARRREALTESLCRPDSNGKVFVGRFEDEIMNEKDRAYRPGV